MAVQPIGTVTLLFTDIEGSTRLLERLGPERYRESLELHRRLLRAAFESHGGYEVDVEGDAFFVAFDRAEDAFAAAVEGQQALAHAEWAEGQEIRVRMGLHTGEPLPVPPNYVGLDVHKAARIMAAAHGSQVLVSATTQRLLDPDAAVENLGEHRLKDLSEPEPLFQLLIDGLPAKFPALKTLGNRPTNLPVQPNVLIGREQEIAELTALLREPEMRLVTMSGPGGTGKTRLALQVAAELLDDFTSGVFFVSLAPVRDARLVVSTVAQTLAVREVPGEPLLDTLTRYLGEKQMLLVLDNFEQVIDAATDVAGLLDRCAKLKLVVTSRERLRLRAERMYAVPPLALVDPAAALGALLANDAVALFTARADDASGGFMLDGGNASAVAEICARLDGLPLAIELAAARTNVLSVHGLLQRLDQRLAVLAGGARDADERQRTLRAAITWSYDLLVESEQLLFARLAVFVDGCRFEAVNAVCDGDGTLGIDVLEGLASLLDKNLLRQRADSDGEPRYWMLETIREYASEQLQARSQLVELARRRGTYFLELAEQAESELEGEGQDRWLQLLDAELPNLRAVLEQAEREREGELLLRIVSGLGTFFDVRGHGSEARRWLARGLEIAGDGVDLELQARAVSWASDLARLQGEVGEAKSLAERAVSLAERSGNQDLLWQALHDLGEALATIGDYEQAREVYERVVRSSAAAGEISAGTIANLGQLAMLTAEWERARALTLEALAEFRIRGRRYGEAMCLANLGHIAIMEGGFSESVDAYERALELALALGFREALATSLLNLGGLLARCGSAEDAARLVGAAEATLAEIALVVDPSDREWYASSVTLLESRLDPARLAVARSEGATLTPSEVATLAISAARAAVGVVAPPARAGQRRRS